MDAMWGYVVKTIMFPDIIFVVVGRSDALLLETLLEYALIA